MPHVLVGIISTLASTWAHDVCRIAVLWTSDAVNKDDCLDLPSAHGGLHADFKSDCKSMRSKRVSFRLIVCLMCRKSLPISLPLFAYQPKAGVPPILCTHATRQACGRLHISLDLHTHTRRRQCLGRGRAIACEEFTRASETVSVGNFKRNTMDTSVVRQTAGAVPIGNGSLCPEIISASRDTID